MDSFDTTVVGGGLMGTAIAYGLARKRLKVALLDEGDVAIRPSRGNFGLVWVQGKGADYPAYASWTRLSSSLWVDFALELRDLTGVDVAHSRPGGLDLCHSETELEQRSETMRKLHRQAPEEFPYEMLDRDGVRAMLPDVGDAVLGASYCPLDGHVNPLYLLRALHRGFSKLGGHYLPNHAVERILHHNSSFTLQTGGQAVSTGQVVLAAGLGNARLAPQVGLDAPVGPNRGQVLVTERVRPFLSIPTVQVRQTAEGSVMLGDSHEDVGLDDGTTPQMMADIARHAVSTFPLLEGVRLVRTWGALRVMTADGIPIYDASESCPGAFHASCHSGVTLAACHARWIADWVSAERTHALIPAFSAERFHVQTTP